MHGAERMAHLTFVERVHSTRTFLKINDKCEVFDKEASGGNATEL
jgi:hypothetical protein